MTLSQNLLSKDEKIKLFGDGEWVSEPDRIQWKDYESGYDCLIKRNIMMGFLCGYVGIPNSHPDHNKDFYDIDVEVHGGLTYANHCDGDPDEGICHRTEDTNDDVWWVGFDCGHGCDHTPVYDVRWPEIFGELGNKTYKDVKYVKKEISNLIKQLKEREK